jgi:hypothetical protein
VNVRAIAKPQQTTATADATATETQRIQQIDPGTLLVDVNVRAETDCRTGDASLRLGMPMSVGWVGFLNRAHLADRDLGHEGAKARTQAGCCLTGGGRPLLVRLRNGDRLCARYWAAPHSADGASRRSPSS